MYKAYIKDEIAEEQFQIYYGKDYKLKIEMQYQGMFKNTPIDIIFTADNKACWLAKYKGMYYAQMMDNIELKDKYTVIDIYTSLLDNAKDSLKVIKK